MVRLVLFDIDGTLIATGGAGVKAFADVARARFGRPGVVETLTFAGRTDVSLVREFFGRAGIPATDENFRAFLDDYVFWLDHHLHRLQGRILPGVRELIAGLRQLPTPPLLGLLTGNLRLGAELKLRHLGLWPEFEIGAFADDHEDRNRIAAVARERGEEHLGGRLDDSEVLVIGDTPHDIACARAIRARCLAVATGGVPLPALQSHQPEHAVPSLAAVSAAQLCA